MALTQIFLNIVFISESSFSNIWNLWLLNEGQQSKDFQTFFSVHDIAHLLQVSIETCI